MAEERERVRPSQAGSIPGVRNDRFGWQADEEVEYLDDDGNPISAEDFRQRLARDAEAARRG